MTKQIEEIVDQEYDNIMGKGEISDERFITLHGLMKACAKFKAKYESTDGESKKLDTKVSLNDKEISVLNGLATQVQVNDEIVFIPVVHGG